MTEMVEMIATAIGNVKDWDGEPFNCYHSRDELRSMARAAMLTLTTPPNDTRQVGKQLRDLVAWGGQDTRNTVDQFRGDEGK